jgi:phosphatidylglycerophosphatase A
MEPIFKEKSDYPDFMHILFLIIGVILYILTDVLKESILLYYGEKQTYDIVMFRLFSS